MAEEVLPNMRFAGRRRITLKGIRTDLCEALEAFMKQTWEESTMIV